PCCPRFPYTTLFRSHDAVEVAVRDHDAAGAVDVGRIQVAQDDLEVEAAGLEARRVQDALAVGPGDALEVVVLAVIPAADHALVRSEEHTSELQSREN